MITVPEAADKIIKRSRYLSEAISKSLINLSALARYIKPELEEMLNKKVSHTAVSMALNRLAASIKPKYIFKNIFKSSPDMIVQSNLIGFTISNSEKLADKCPSILKLSNTNNRHFLTITRGVFDTTIIASKDLAKNVREILKDEVSIAEFTNLSSITIKLPKEAISTPGIYYFFLKSLAWEGVNIIEIVSSYLEFTLILPEKETNKAFSILQSLFALSV